MIAVLVYAEHDNASLKDATLAVVTAASQLGEVHACWSLAIGHAARCRCRSKDRWC